MSAVRTPWSCTRFAAAGGHLRSALPADLLELPWWTGVLLTLADLMNQPMLTVAVWAVAGLRIGFRVIRVYFSGRPDPARNLPGEQPGPTGS